MVLESSPITRDALSFVMKETFLRGVLHFDQTDSTNTQALALLSSSQEIKTPYLVYAESQLGGRGRGSNRWWSQSGSLTVSVIVDTGELGLSPEKQPQLSLITGLALQKTGQALLPRGDFAVKWPNDVYLAGRKLAGILIEIPAQSSCHAVIGVGLNVNNLFSQAPEELQHTGISLSDLSGRTYDRADILKSFLQQLDELIQRLAQGDSVLEEWPEHCLLTGRQVTLQTGPIEVTGLCQGIDPAGALLLKTDEGLQRFLGGIVKSWK